MDKEREIKILKAQAAELERAIKEVSERLARLAEEQQ
jgi:predicted  nucleic acid-binding Zn-ribbon protein